MKPTKILSLAIGAFLAAVATYGIVRAIIASGGSVPVSPRNLLISIPLIAVIEVAIAIPIFRYRRELSKFAETGKRPKRVDPFYAVRILALAKATAISGSLFVGFAVSLVILQLGLPVIPDSIWQNAVAFVESIVLTVVAVIIERACKLPDDGESAEANTAPNPGVTPA